MQATINLNNSRDYIKAQLHLAVEYTLLDNIKWGTPEYSVQITKELMNKFNTVMWDEAYRKQAEYHKERAAHYFKTGNPSPICAEFLSEVIDKYKVDPTTDIDGLEIEIGFRIINE